jgi:hypothetical protein
MSHETNRTSPAASASWTGITIYRIRDGAVVSERGVEDGLGFLRQIGAMPNSAAAANARR